MMFNVNNTVRVQLTPFGRERYREDYKELTKRYPESLPSEDADGWSEWQLWDLMATFGRYFHLSMGDSRSPFKFGIKIPVSPNEALKCLKDALDS